MSTRKLVGCQQNNYPQTESILIENGRTVDVYSSLRDKPGLYKTQYLHLDNDFGEYFLQSSDEAGVSVNEASSEQQQIMGFSDDTSGKRVVIPSTMADAQIDTSEDCSLGEFFSRPVLIKSYSWVESNSFNESFEPWHLFFNYPQIKKKLDNYYLLRCKLNLKFIINASPFYYSCVMVSYRPLTSFNPAPVVSGVGVEKLAIMGRSQRPKAFIYPQNSEGCEMQLPFFYHMNWLDATDETVLMNMGTIYMDDLFISLSNANSTVGQTVTIQVYAWASDVELAGPTFDLALQSGDEYGQGVISKPASAIARASMALADFPVIGAFATATSMVSGTVAAVASLFGYTNVPVIADVHYFKDTAFPQMATTEIGVPIEKLTLDCKNELTIDPKTTGLDCGDEMSISAIASRESYIETFTWGSSLAPDALILSGRVQPGYTQNATIGGKFQIQGTPGWMVNQVFKYWRGDVIYRFKFICTKYHRGRLRLTWDPHAYVANTSDTNTTSYNKIIDLSTDTDVEFRIPFTQPTSYLRTVSQGATTGISSTALTNVVGETNGTFSLRVLNAQSSPVASADVYIAVFVRCADNIEFADPRDPPSFYCNYPVQSGLEYDTPETIDMGIKPSMASSHINKVYMGETIKSFRQVMRRKNLSLALSSKPNIDSTYYISQNLRRMPLMYGFDSNGIEVANEVYGGATAPFNYCYNTIVNWVNMCFIAHRGSIHWDVNTILPDTSVGHVSVTREIQLTTAGYNRITQATAVSDADHSSNYRRYVRPGHSGMYLTNQNNQSGVSVSIPMYSPYKFLSNNRDTRTNGGSDDDTQSDSFEVQINGISDSAATEDSRITVEYYCSIGTDFSCVFFLNVPTVFQLSAVPSPA